MITAFLTEDELATRWLKSPKTIQAMRQRGNGPKYLKLGAAVRYRLADIEAHENSHIRESTSQQVAA